MARIKTRFILALSILIGFQIKTLFLQNLLNSEDSSDFNPPNKVIISSVYCRPKKIPILKDKYFDQTLVMLKSTLISAYLYNISALEIHLFLEHMKDKSYFEREVLEKMAIPKVTVKLQVHSAVDKVPKRFIDHMIYHPRYRCGYVRLYTAEVLTDVDSIIYLDSDIIVTGDLMEHWKLLSRMDSHQMIAVGRDSPEENKHYFNDYNNFFKSKWSNFFILNDITIIYNCSCILSLCFFL